MTTTPTPIPPVHANRVRGPFNSWLLAVLEGHFERRLAATRAQLFGDVPEEVVEIGAGNGGPTFAHYPPGTRVHAVEPNRAFHPRLRHAAVRHDIDLVIHGTGAEHIPLPDASIDAVVSSWVLCTVADQEPVLAEVRRVLRPGGRFLFLEHVAAPTGSWVHRVQRVVHGPWRWLFEGCHTDRDTAGAVRAAGFAQVETRPVTVSTPFVPIRPQVAGIARR